MDFAFTPEQDELIRALRAFARKELAPRSARWDKTGESDSTRTSRNAWTTRGS